MAAHRGSRRRTSGFLLAAAALFCEAPRACAQAFEISAGASTIYGAAGGTLLVHGENSEMTLGAGVANHRFGAGGAVQHRTGDRLSTFGMQTMRADVPTDIFAPTHVLVGLGAGISQGSPGSEQHLQAFAGFGSVNGGSPLFATGDVERPMLFSQWERHLFGGCRAVATAISFRQTLALGSLGCGLQAKGLWNLAGTAGGSPQGGYGAGSVTFQGTRLQLQAAYIHAGAAIDRSTVLYASLPEPDGINASVTYLLSRAWTISAVHEKFAIAPYQDNANPSLDTPREQTSLNQLSLGYHRAATGFSLSAISSTLRFPPGQSSLSNTLAQTFGNSSNASLTASFEHDFGPLRWTENVVRSRASAAPGQTLSISSLALRLNPHLLGSVSANVADGHLSFAPGGEWLTASTRLRVDYQLLYLANRPQTPFQQAIEVNAGVRLWHAVGLEVASSISPVGTTGYTLRFTTFGAHNAPAGGAGLGVQVGNSVLTGRVVDEEGLPVSGAVLSIDNTSLFTDTTGVFCFRERRPADHLLHVLLEEFLSPGHFTLSSAPSHVSSQLESQARPLRIVVARRPLSTSATPHSPGAQQTVAMAESDRPGTP